MLEGHAGKNIACVSLLSVQNSGECLIEQSAGILNYA